LGGAYINLLKSLTQTPLAEKLLSNNEKIEAAAKRHPLQAIGLPENLAAMVTFIGR
jgi:3-oxoacyl-[acyl-carrier protein] reductase